MKSKKKLIIFGLAGVVTSDTSETTGIRYLISELKDGRKVALLADYHEDRFDDIDKRYGLRKLFDAVFAFGSAEPRNSGLEEYRAILDRFQVSVNEVLFVGNNDNELLRAESLGIDTIRFEDTVQLAQKLKEELGVRFRKPMHIFRSYDVRGIYGLDLDEDVARKIGVAFAELIGPGKDICVGGDYRIGSDSLRASFMKGALLGGSSVVDFGRLPSPVLYSSVIAKKLDGGAMITASHNPAIWNGVKMCRKGAEMVCEGHGMEELRDIFAKERKVPHEAGNTRTEDDAIELYFEKMLKKIRLERRIKVVLDPGNGAWCGTAKELFERLGCEVVEINGRPDGRFPARGPDPTDEALAGLKNKVVETSADLGVGFDGDGDRAGLVDDRGRYVGTGDIIVSIFARHYLKSHRNRKVVYDVICSEVVSETVQSLGGTALICKSGHPHVATLMVKEGALLAGEYSNHFYFSDNSNLDDGCYAALKMTELLSNSEERLSAISDSIPHYPRVPETAVDCADNMKFEVIRELQKKFKTMDFERIVDIDGIKAFTKDGWVLVRASNTMPQIKVNSEARDLDTAKKLFTLGRDMVAKEISKRNAQ
jgi:phosphomannomutase/phosphoglucomutase